jgi:predicted DNA-binding protein (UPF0251 family)
MARGWESKGVADQIEEGEQARPNLHPQAKSAEERLKLDRLESLRLSKARSLEQLERAKHPSHREVLIKGLRAIEKEIEEIG